MPTCQNVFQKYKFCKVTTSESAVIVAKLTYAASAWWGSAAASDRSRLQAVLRRGKLSGLCTGDVTTYTITDLVGCAVGDAVIFLISLSTN